MTDTITKAADLLMQVRQGGARIANLGAAAPASAAEAWGVQKEVLRLMGGSIGGYKCATPPGKPQTGAIMAAAGIKHGPTSWPVAKGERIGIETEIAFRFARDLPGRATPYSQDEVLDAVAAAFPVIELVVSRYVDHTKVAVEESMADNIGHAGLVMGADVADWRRHDLKSLVVRQTYGTEVQVEKPGGNPSGDPLLPLVWLVNELPKIGLHIQAGQVVTTGSCTGCLWVESHQRVVGGFHGFGEVTVDLA